MPDMPVNDILDYLHVQESDPTTATLDALLLAWAIHIPWETASRMARHQRPGTPADYARQPAQFFADALQLGTGGTCFESNLAFQALLDALGFAQTLAFCSMETVTVEPHCAVLVTIDGTRYLADVGYPVAAALPLQSVPTQVDTPSYIYEAAPVAAERWHIQRTSDSFRQTSFWVHGEPITPARFQRRLLRDHEAGGLFLDEVIIHRAMPLPDKSPRAWPVLRYNEGKGLVRRSWGREEAVPLTAAEEADLPGALARQFGMDRRVIASALYRQPPLGLWQDA